MLDMTTLQTAAKIAGVVTGCYAGVNLLRLGTAWAEYGLKKLMPPKYIVTIPKEKKTGE